MVVRVVDIENKLQCSQGLWVKTLDSTSEIVSSRLDDAGPLEWIFHMLVERHMSHDNWLEFADEMRRSLFKITLSNRLRANSSERRNPNMVTVLSGYHPCSSRRALKTSGSWSSTIAPLFEIANDEVKDPHCILNHDSSSWSCTIWKNTGATMGILTFCAKCRDGGFSPAFVITSGWKKNTVFHAKLCHHRALERLSISLDLGVMRDRLVWMIETRNLDVVTGLVIIKNHDVESSSPPCENQTLKTSQPCLSPLLCILGYLSLEGDMWWQSDT